MKTYDAKSFRKKTYYSEFANFEKNCIKSTEATIKNRNDFLKHLKITPVNETVPFMLNYDFERDTKLEIAILNQKIRSICENAHHLGLKPIFFTVTLPSEYHCCRTKLNAMGKIRYDNVNYKYNSFIEGLRAGADYHREIWENLRLNIEERFKKKWRFVKCFEMHEDYTLHLHCLIFVDNPEVFKTQYYRILDKYKLNPEFCPIDEIGKNKDYEQIKESRQAANYVLKTAGYVSKALNETNLKHYKFIKGAKRLIGLPRWITYSSKGSLPIYLWKPMFGVFRDYPELKDEYLDRANENESCLMSEIMKDSYIVRKIYNSEDTLKQMNINLKYGGESNNENDYMFKFEATIEKRTHLKNGENVTSYLLRDLVILYNKVEIYRKPIYNISFVTLDEIDDQNAKLAS